MHTSKWKNKFEMSNGLLVVTFIKCTVHLLQRQSSWWGLRLNAFLRSKMVRGHGSDSTFAQLRSIV